MCGIFGAIHQTGRFDWDAVKRFVEMTDLVKYRGPDDSGYIALIAGQSQVAQNEPFQIFLGHRRLSIIDLSSAGHQPMTDGKGRWITYNGEVFNFVELRKELEACGHCFVSGTDTEVILHLYDQYGEEGFDLLNGMWALALADLPRRRVVLSRDRFSIKPMYLLSLGDKHYFSSEIKQLLPFLPSKRLNEEVMSVFLRQGLVDFSADSFLRGITRVPPKTNIVIDLHAGARTVQQYWSYPERSRPAWAEAIERFRYLFLDSVRIRLRSDVKVGVMLSGGIDSSAISVLSDALVGGSKLETFSVISSDRDFSEEPFINCLCRNRKINNRKLVFQPTNVLETLREVIHHNDEPFLSLSVLAQYQLLEMIKRESDATVLLSGQGGDEILLGYHKFFFFYVQRLWKHRSYAKAIMQLIGSLLQRTVVCQFRWSEAKRYVPSFGNGQVNRFVRLAGEPVPLWECADLRERQLLDIDRYSVPALARYEDRNSMAHSLELRHPFLDHRLVGFVTSLPPEMKISKGWTKFILRKACHELPNEIRWRRDKQGFVTPEESWLRKDLAKFIRRTFAKSTLGQAGILDDQKFLAHYGEFEKKRSPIWHMEISRVLIAEAWAQKFLR